MAWVGIYVWFDSPLCPLVVTAQLQIIVVTMRRQKTKTKMSCLSGLVSEKVSGSGFLSVCKGPRIKTSAEPWSPILCQPFLPVLNILL